MGVAITPYTQALGRTHATHAPTLQAHHGLVLEQTCCPSDNCEACEDAIQAAEHHGLEVIPLLTVRLFVSLTGSGIMKEPVHGENIYQTDAVGVESSRPRMALDRASVCTRLNSKPSAGTMRLVI